MSEFRFVVLSAAVLFAGPAFAGNQTATIVASDTNLAHDASVREKCKGRNCARGARSWQTSEMVAAPVSKGRNSGRQERPIPEGLQTFAQK